MKYAESTEYNERAIKLHDKLIKCGHEIKRLPVGERYVPMYWCKTCGIIYYLGNITPPKLYKSINGLGIEEATRMIIYSNKWCIRKTQEILYCKDETIKGIIEWKKCMKLRQLTVLW